VNKELIQKMQSQFDALARIESCISSDYVPIHHFRDITKMVFSGSGAWDKA
jgi:hypothetical protein